MSTSSYVIISPVRNEEKYIEKTLLSIISQTILPAEYIIVDDGSSDGTATIVKKIASNNPWIRIISKMDRGDIDMGRGVMEACNMGIKEIRTGDWDYIVKLDGDLLLEPDYFSILLGRFRKNKKLGIAGGTCYVFKNGKIAEEAVPSFHPMAAARIYRRKCFEDIGGFIETLGWDTIDLLRAQMKGWETVRYPDLKIKHLRMMSSRKGLWEGKVRLGRNFYITGYHPLFLIARSIYRLMEPPFFVETFGVIYGYLKALLNNERLVVTKEEKRFLRRQQLRRLIGVRV